MSARATAATREGSAAPLVELDADESTRPSAAAGAGGDAAEWSVSNPEGSSADHGAPNPNGRHNDGGAAAADGAASPHAGVTVSETTTGGGPSPRTGTAAGAGAHAGDQASSNRRGSSINAGRPPLSPAVLNSGGRPRTGSVEATPTNANALANSTTSRSSRRRGRQSSASSSGQTAAPGSDGLARPPASSTGSTPVITLPRHQPPTLQQPEDQAEQPPPPHLQLQQTSHSPASLLAQSLHTPGTGIAQALQAQLWELHRRQQRNSLSASVPQDSRRPSGAVEASLRSDGAGDADALALPSAAVAVLSHTGSQAQLLTPTSTNRRGSGNSISTVPAQRRTHQPTPVGPATGDPMAMPVAQLGAIGAQMQRRNEEQARRTLERQRQEIAEQQQHQQQQRRTESAGRNNNNNTRTAQPPQPQQQQRQSRGASNNSRATNAAANTDSTDRRNLYVEGVPVSMTEDLLQMLFEEHGDVESVRLNTTADGRTQGFVLMRTRAQAAAAVSRLHRASLEDSVLQVRFATRDPPAPAPARGRSAGADGRLSQRPPQLEQHSRQQQRPPQQRAVAASGSALSRSISPSVSAHGAAQQQQSYVYVQLPSGGYAAYATVPAQQQQHQQRQGYAPAAQEAAPRPSGLASAQPSQRGGLEQLPSLLAQRNELWARLQLIDSEIQSTYASALDAALQLRQPADPAPSPSQPQHHHQQPYGAYYSPAGVTHVSAPVSPAPQYQAAAAAAPYARGQQQQQQPYSGRGNTMQSTSPSANDMTRAPVPSASAVAAPGGGGGDGDGWTTVVSPQQIQELLRRQQQQQQHQPPRASS